MKNVNRVLLGCALMIVVVLLIAFWMFSERAYPIETVYGDSFTVCGGGFTGEYCILDDNAAPVVPIQKYDGAKDLKPVCDSRDVRAYRFMNEEEDFYILKIKQYDHYLIIDRNDDQYTMSVFNSERGRHLKNVFLCDAELMEMMLPYLDSVYHDEMMDAAQNMVSRNYHPLSQYGLSQEMHEDQAGLQRKTQILDSYLKANGK